MSRPRPVCLIILDGFGVAPEGSDNAIALARTPGYDSYLRDCPQTTLAAAGLDVGLPDGQMGNSEVGHLNIGAGRVVYQELTRIDRAIEDGSFFENPVLVEAVENAKADGRALHLMGLLSDGGVHSKNTHLYSLLRLAKARGLESVFVHCFLDGRDTPPQSALNYIEALELKMREIGVGQIATVCGRYYAMDRDRRWDRVKLAYDALVYGHGAAAPTAEAAVEQSYSADENDEFVKPTVISVVAENDNGRINNGDSVIFFNFRADRARELTEALITPDFRDFDRGPGPPKVDFVCLTQYEKSFDSAVAFKPENIKNTLAEVVAANGLKQLHIAETEKYAHVTFFFNGGIEEPVPGEDRVLVPSPKVATYDTIPEMSAFEVADKTVTAIKSGKYDFIVINFANADMVGHTGYLDAAVKALEAVDQAVRRVVDAALEQGGVALITADHGNAEHMRGPNGDPWTAHTTSRVPLVLVGGAGVRLKNGARLADIAPTVLSLLDLPVPAEMTGENLLER
jgi:2,3-bisphosphoglycerate-independent phosphoglycerate mutase